MTRYIYVVESGFSDPEQESAWNQWYENVHLPRIMATAGFHKAARYRRISGEVAEYLAIYDIEGPNTLEQEEYRNLPGWESWRVYITDWSRHIYKEVTDLGTKYRESVIPYVD